MLVSTLMFITPALQVALTLGLKTESTPWPPVSTLLDKSPEHLTQDTNNAWKGLQLTVEEKLQIFQTILVSFISLMIDGILIYSGNSC